MLRVQDLSKMFHERNYVQWKFARATFEIWQRIGFHVVSDHFYDPIPNTNTVRNSYTDGPRQLPAITADWSSLTLDACVLMDLYLDDYLQNRASFGYKENNSFFAGLDALYYYSFIRSRKPQRIIEIGQGSSTCIALAALARNAGEGQELPELISIDPYSRVTVQVPPLIRYSFINKPLQKVENDIPSMIAAGDLLFVDSSHVFKFGSDVQILFERVYPRLAYGVFLHMHDIFTPFDYPKEWMLKDKRFWNEQYVLESFLSYNKEFDILAPVHYVARDATSDQLLSKHNLGYDIVGRWGCSLYLIKCLG